MDGNFTMTTLESIGAVNGTDKVTHGFLPFYASFMESNRENPIRFLEIGVFYGSSIKMWAEYFSNKDTVIVGADWFEGKQGNSSHFPNPNYIFSQILSPNIRLAKLDQSDIGSLQKFAESYAKSAFEYILDDGSHLMKDQQTTFVTLFPLVKSGGVYIIEDLHTSFQTGYDVEKGKMTTYEMVESFTRNTFPELSYTPLPIGVFQSIASVQLFRSPAGSLTCAIVKR
jgi:hypothetical protein